LAHNWTKETLGECAKTHLDQLIDYLALVDDKKRLIELERIINHYWKIRLDIDSKEKQ
jgi:hypothetical protein